MLIIAPFNKKLKLIKMSTSVILPVSEALIQIKEAGRKNFLKAFGHLSQPGHPPKKNFFNISSTSEKIKKKGIFKPLDNIFHDKWNVHRKVFLQLEAVLPGYQSN